LIKGNIGSVRIVRDEAQPDKLLPDVSLKKRFWFELNFKL